MNLSQSLSTAALLASLALASAFSAPAPASAVRPAVAAADAWPIDPAHSTSVFRIRHMGAAWIYGRLGTVSGTISYDAAKPESSSVSVTMQVDGIDTGNAKRDAHLKSPDFFDVKQFPTATFTSKSVKKSGEKKATVTGDLSLHGVTKPVTVEIEETGTSKSEHGTFTGFLGTFTIKRGDFGISYGLPDNVGDEVFVTISLEATH
jgi:polyisoprenoid-binding protein YceI